MINVIMSAYDIAVIGGGAAGMLAAAVAAERGARVLMVERNSVFGKKLRITGKGRCNLTNDCTVSDALGGVTTGARFMHSSLSGFTPSDAMQLFESLGVPLKTERGYRVFPQSDKAGDVADALRKYMEDSGASVLHERASRITAKDGRVAGIATSGAEISCGAVILATGGVSYPSTGSTGDGYMMARALGHTISPLRASLVPIEAEPEICSAMQGVTLKNVRLTISDGGQKAVYNSFGELLFTHYGLSGPLALSASAHMRDIDTKAYYAQIDLKPALDEQKLDRRILRDFGTRANRDFSNSLGDLLVKSMIPVIVSKSGIAPETKVHSVTREQRLALARLIKAFRLEISGLRPIEEAIVTSGGVDLREINPKTLESKIIKGLFFAGEVIDADAYTGGFNLQIAWSTAYAAARSASAAFTRS